MLFPALAAMMDPQGCRIKAPLSINYASSRAVVVSSQSLPILEEHGSNPVIGKILCITSIYC